MVDSAANPVDGPTKLEQREAADNDDRYKDNISDRQAQNVRDYHQSEINRLTRAIEQHQAIVDAQDEILSHPSTRGGGSEGRGGRGGGREDEGVADGTDIGEIFDTDANAPDANPEANLTDADGADGAEGDTDTNADTDNPDGTGEGSGAGEEGDGSGSASSSSTTSTTDTTPTKPPRAPNRKGR